MERLGHSNGGREGRKEEKRRRKGQEAGTGVEAFFPPEKSNLMSQVMPSPGESGASLGRSHVVQVSQEALQDCGFSTLILGMS